MAIRRIGGPLWWCVLIVLSGCAKSKETTTFRVGLVTPGSVTDGSWNAVAFTGLKWIHDSLGAAVTNVEARNPGQQEEALRRYAEEGYPLVFAHGHEFQQAAERVSKDHPTTVIVVVSGERAVGNVVPLVLRIEEATYLAGMVAGALTKSGKIGFVGGIALEPIQRGYRGWLNGAKRSRPQVNTSMVYLGNFDDGAAGKEAALAMIRSGVDMLHHNADAAALGLFQAAKESPGVYVFGINADQTAIAPDKVIGSAVIDLPTAFLALAREVKSGSFQPKVESFGLATGAIRYVPNPRLDSLTKGPLQAALQSAADSIIAGTLRPLADQ